MPKMPRAARPLALTEDPTDQALILHNAAQPTISRVHTLPDELGTHLGIGRETAGKCRES